MIGSSRYSDTSTVRPFGSTFSVTFGIETAAAGGPIGGGVARLGPRSDPRCAQPSVAASAAHATNDAARVRGVVAGLGDLVLDRRRQRLGALARAYLGAEPEELLVDAPVEAHVDVARELLAAYDRPIEARALPVTEDRLQHVERRPVGM